ncbi:MAG: hypothetical protein KC613_28085, partial [Myxococcales bacterium]|nr:hypothetical protein [Myxococcales bacterium]
ERAGPPAVWARVDVVAGQARIAQLRAQPKLETLLLLQRAARALLAELDRVAGGLRPLQATDDGVNPGDDHVAFTGPTFTVPTDATRGLDPDPALALPPFAQVQDDLADALPAHLREAYAQAQRRR